MFDEYLIRYSFPELVLETSLFNLNYFSQMHLYIVYVSI